MNLNLMHKIKQTLSPSKMQSQGDDRKEFLGVPGAWVSGNDVRRNNEEDFVRKRGDEDEKWNHDSNGSNGNKQYDDPELKALKESMEWWMTRSRKQEAVNAQLRLQLERMQPGQSGVGKNKQAFWKTEPDDVSNMTTLKETTLKMIWPHNKFLNFTGRWTCYDAVKPHPFAEYVMKQVVVPASFIGSKNDYFRNVALPKIAAKLSTLRGNFVGKCGAAFKGEWSMLLCWLWLCWIVLQTNIHCDCPVNSGPGPWGAHSCIIFNRPTSHQQELRGRCQRV